MRISRNTPETGFTLIETMVALAVFIIILAGSMSSINRLMVFADTADRTMLVTIENQRAMREMKNDLYCSSRNCVGPYAPAIVGDELRFRVVTGFDDVEAKSTFSGYYVCYWLDTENSLLVRRFRDSNDELLEEAPVEYPGAKSQVIGQYCTAVSYSMNVDAGMVTINLTNSIGEDGTVQYAEYTNQFSVIPFNCD